MTHENVPFPMVITKEGAQSLGKKMPNAELYLKEATVYIYGFYLPAARLPELTSKLERLDCSYSTPSTGGSFQLITRRVRGDTELFRFNSLR